MIIAQISDLHIGGPGTRTYGIAAMDEKLKSCIAHVNAHRPKPDVVLVSGDLANCASKAETQYAADLLAALEMPFFVIAGNHDNTDTIKEIFAARQFPPANTQGTDYVIDDYPVRLIGMDSTRSGQPGGYLNGEQLAWLEKTLAQDSKKPVVIFMHHPPVRCGVPETDEDGFEGSERLGRIVGRFDNVQRILCGHIHLPVHTLWHGTIVCSAPSIGMHLEVELDGDEPSQFVLGAPAYLLHHLGADGNLLTHTKSLAPVDGPYRFEEQ